AGIRFAYSWNPSWIHAGILWPTDRMRMRTRPWSGRAPGRRLARGPPPRRRRRRPVHDLVETPVRPELLEVVVLANRGLHHVGHYVARVHQDPLAGFLALGAHDGGAGFLQPVAHVARERLRLACRYGARHHDPVADRGELVHVDGLDVARLDVLQRGNDQLLLGERR